MTREWTPKEEQLLCRLVVSGVPRKEVATRLARSPSAIGHRLWKLGILGNQRPKGELMRLVEEQCERRVKVRGKNRRLYDWEIALEIGVEPSTVAKARNRLGISPANIHQAARARMRHASSGQWGASDGQAVRRDTAPRTTGRPANSRHRSA